ncbi:RACGAP1 isoform 28 [Pan troglodytes]|uniref:RACGAP1 isoform 28 n=2 Tax=Pan troglodytes TaxID=9598 RepID=A0A6D2XT21_PANTR|nr:RACGAP1 isoform 28 [Pan troglodytes]
MDVANLAKVFGPTIVAHAVPNPDPVTMLQDIKRQPKVVERLLSLPLEYWSQFMMVEQENIDPLHVIENSNAFSTPQTPDIKAVPRGGLCVHFTAGEAKIQIGPPSCGQNKSTAAFNY